MLQCDEQSRSMFSESVIIEGDLPGGRAARCPHLCEFGLNEMDFYEKVIKVKADVAAFLINCFPFHRSICKPSGGDVGNCQGRPRQGAFILTLDSSPRH